MSIRVTGAIMAALRFVALATVAHAQTPVDCVGNPTTALGIALAKSVPNSVLAISGICQQQVTLAAASELGITLTNHTGSPTAPLVPTDGVAGQIAVMGNLSVAIDSITLEGTPTDTGLLATVLLQRGATATITNAQIVDGQRIGLALLEAASARVENSVISGNGIAGVVNASDGIRAVGGSQIQLGAMSSDGSLNASAAVSVSGNKGNGIFVGANSRLTMSGGSVAGNSQDQSLAAGAALAVLVGTEVTQSAPSTAPGGGYAIQGLGTTTVMLADGVTVSAGTVAGGVQVATASDLILLGADISNATTSYPAVDASGNSSIVLSGGNQITNGAANGLAIKIDHDASLMQTLYGGLAAEMAPGPWSAAPSADTIAGAGSAQMQSTMDLGVGLVAGNPSLAWTGNINMSQESTFRMSGGAMLNGSLVLAQGSAGFFNNANGGSGNVVSGGVTCPGAVAVSHVTAGANTVLLAPGGTASAVMFGAAPPACPSF